LATDAPNPQRVYRALCPQCGAPVEFRSAASASAVCSYCRSTLLREGDALRRIGRSAELFDDHSPLRLGAGGRHQGVAFTIVGRLQYAYEGGTWNEWHALFDTGRSGWLSEDNGRYVMAFDAPAPPGVPRAEALRAGERQALDGRAWSVASVTRATLLAAEGELPRPPVARGPFVVADLRNEAGEVATLDYSEPDAPQWSVGRSVALSELAMSGLADTSEKTLGSRGFACPSCGAPLEVKLASTQSIVCGQCRAVVDVSQGAGADLAHYRQSTGTRQLEPELPLGATGTLALGPEGALPWQVVGYQERHEVGSDEEGWREYLLYHRTAGFAVLVSAEDGWSAVVPITGAPEVRGVRARYGGVEYREQFRYAARTAYVLGEFYWRVERDQLTQHVDYAGTGRDARKRLNREQSADEVTWSAGETLDAQVVAKAFGVPVAARPAPAGDVTPFWESRSGIKLLVAIVVIVVLVELLSQCSSDDCDELRATFGPNSNEYQQCVRSGGSGRTGGSSFGGFRSGGGHK
jgi:hypothetical protein